MLQQETARAVGILCHPWKHAHLSEKSRLLVTRRASQGHIPEAWHRNDFAVHFAEERTVGSMLGGSRKV